MTCKEFIKIGSDVGAVNWNVLGSFARLMLIK